MVSVDVVLVVEQGWGEQVSVEQGRVLVAQERVSVAQERWSVAQEPVSVGEVWVVGSSILQ